jgi:hypothetical protein
MTPEEYRAASGLAAGWPLYTDYDSEVCCVTCITDDVLNVEKHDHVWITVEAVKEAVAVHIVERHRERLTP